MGTLKDEILVEIGQTISTSKQVSQLTVVGGQNQSLGRLVD